MDRQQKPSEGTQLIPRLRRRQKATMDIRSWFKDLTGYFLYLLTVAQLGPYLFGYHLAELNVPGDVIRCIRKGIRIDASLPQCIPMGPLEFGVVQSIFTLGGLFGALAAGPISTRYGRKRTMQFTTLFFVIGAGLEAVSMNVGVMTVGRFLSGVGAGSSLVSVPIYISEVAPPGEKGLFGSFTQVFVNIGIFTTQLLGFFLSEGQWWRIILLVAGLVGVIQFAGLFLVVESPKWRADKGDPAQAKRDLKRIRGHDFDISEEVLGWGLESTQEEEEEQETLLSGHDRMSHHSGSEGSKKKMAKQEAVGFFDVIRHPDHNKAILAVIVVMIAQQFTGINSVIMYGVSLLSDLLEANAALLNVAVSALNIIVTTAAAPLVDKLGRKRCLLYSCAGMGINSLLLGIGLIKGISILSAIAVLLFVSSFALGLGPVPFLLSSELAGPEAVGATQSWALAFNWTSTFIVAQFFPIVNEKMGKGKVYFLFTGLGLFFFLFIWWFVPETKGKKDADEVWGRERRVD